MKLIFSETGSETQKIDLEIKHFIVTAPPKKMSQPKETGVGRKSDSNIVK